MCPWVFRFGLVPFRVADRRNRSAQLGAQASTDGNRASGCRGPAAIRDIWWLPKRGEGRSRPEPNLPAMPSWGGARALRRGGGAGGELRTLRGLAAASLSRVRAAARGDGGRDVSDAGNGGGDDAIGCRATKGLGPESWCGVSRSASSREL